MKDGLLTPEVFSIDTSKIRICGKGQADFRKERLDLKMAPTPKKPEYFNLATPIEVNGSFADFGVGIQSGGLIGTVVRFVVSPLTTTSQRLVGKDVCAMQIRPENRSVKLPGGCK